MSWTKRQFVNQAFEEIGYAPWAFDLESDQLESAMRRLDSMMATWNSKGVKINYPLPSSPESSDLDDETEVPDHAVEAIYLNLAIRLAPTVGKTVTRETKVSAKMAYNQLLNRMVKPVESKFPNTLPLGSGNKAGIHDNTFIVPESDGIITNPDNEAEFKI